MHRRVLTRYAPAASAVILTAAWTASAAPGAAAAAKARPTVETAGTYTVSSILSGASLSHPVADGSEKLKGPDDIAELGGNLFVGFQNGVGSVGEASRTGNTASTLVELDQTGAVLNQWDLVGKIDGLGADPAHHQLVATVDEDGNSSLYTVRPAAAAGAQVEHYHYAPSSLPHGGGTDAVSFYNGQILISASAPTDSTQAAVYSVTLQPSSGTATYKSVFADNATATDAVTGQPTTLALTDPDSNEVVPGSSPRFPGDFMLNSQGDQQQIYVHDAGGPAQTLSVLNLSQAVDDSAWATDPAGVLYATDSAHNTVDRITGPFHPGQVFAAVTPCNANSAPAVCPAPTYPANYLGSIDLATGAVTSLTTTGDPIDPKGLIFVTGDPK